LAWKTQNGGRKRKYRKKKKRKKENREKIKRESKSKRVKSKESKRNPFLKNQNSGKDLETKWAKKCGKNKLLRFP